jgi:hypothetical protein
MICFKTISQPFIREISTLRAHAGRVIANPGADDVFKARRLTGLTMIATAKVLLILKGLKMLGFATTGPMVAA